jgi:hypothetical protein
MALKHSCVSIGDPSTYSLIRIATCARTSVRADTSAAPPRATAAHASVTDRAQSAAVRAGPEAAYTKDKPVTEAVFHAPMFALKADAELNACEPRPRRSAAAGKCSHALARMRARPRTHTSARARTHASACTSHMSASAIRAYDDRRTRQGVCIHCI